MFLIKNIDINPINGEFKLGVHEALIEKVFNFLKKVTKESVVFDNFLPVDTKPFKNFKEFKEFIEKRG